jgi:hypothetical protein
MTIICLIIGNVCSLLAMATDSISSSQKKISNMLWIQNASQLFYCIGSAVLKGYSGSVQNVICIIRNLVVIKKINNKFIEWTLVFVGVALGLYFNYVSKLGVLGLLPIIANLQYTLAVFKFKDNERILKISFLINAFLFVFFCLAIWNLVGVCTNFIVAVTTIIFLVKTKKNKTT